MHRVAIVGAGIVGLYLAWKLCQKGEKVVVFEKRNRIGKECCSGLFSERILKFFPQSKKLIENEINSVLVHFPKKTIRVDFKKKFFVINHAELDKTAAGLAEAEGAEICLGQEAGANLLSSGFDRVIGCDGALSRVRKDLGLPDPEFRLGMRRFVSQKNCSSYLETWAVPGGFSWKIPRGNQIEFGAIVPLKSVKNFHTSKYGSFALVPQGLIVPKNERITLCGDAAGLTKPWSGGGVVWGLTAADLLLKNFPNMLKYRQDVRRLFITQIALSKLTLKLVYYFGFNLPGLLPSKIKMEGDFVL